MHPDDQSLQPQEPQANQAAQTPQRWIHPDTLKFMGMAKELLESPAVKEAIDQEQDPAPPDA